jgi:ABC-2 type transport system permease protein
MNKFVTLLKREYWENRGALLITPIAMGAIYIVSSLMGIGIQMRFDNSNYTLREGIRALSGMDSELLSFIFYQIQLGPLSAIFTTALGIVVIFYLLGALYDDRKNKSILFWKSLPASDKLTMASKLTTAMLVAPLLFWVVMVLTHIVLMFIGSVMIWVVGMSAWDIFLSNLQPLKAWGMILLMYMAQAIWALPLYGWLLLVSSFAPRIPILFAILPPVIFGFLQWWITFLRTFTFGKQDLFGAIGHWFANSPIILSINVDDEVLRQKDMFENGLGIPLFDDFDHAVTIANIFDRLISTQMLIGLGLAAILLSAAWWLRRRAAEV